MVNLPRPITKPSLRQVRLPREQVTLATDIDRATLGIKPKKRKAPTLGNFAQLDVRQGIF